MLGSKKRIVVDKNIFLDLVREGPENVAPGGTGVDKAIVNDQFIDMNMGEIIGNTADSAKALGCFFLPYTDVDTLRVALGRYWDYEAKTQSYNTNVVYIPDLGLTLTHGATTEKIFHHKHPATNIIFGMPITWAPCPGAAGEIEYLGLGGNSSYFGGIKQELLISSTWNMHFGYPKWGGVRKYLGLQNMSKTEISDAGYTRNFGTYWTYLMKTGIITADGRILNPIIKSTNLNSVNPQVYYDHYHNVMSPYTPDELNNQQAIITGEASYASYKTYYNSRTYSKDYENFIANPIYQNSLPNIHALAKIANNPELAKNSFLDLSNMINYMEAWYEDPNELEDPSTIRNDTYNNLFQQFPLEASILLYGAMAEDDPDTIDENELGVILERLVSLDIKSVDADSLFIKYLENFRNVLLNDPQLNKKPLTADISAAVTALGGNYAIAPGVKIGALEYINSNLLFGSNASTILHEAKQYKDYFPMYCEINFTAQKTLLGDKIKKSKITNFLGQEIAAAQSIYGWDPSLSLGGFLQDNSINREFVDYLEKNIYEDITDLEPVAVPAFSETWMESYKVNSKKTFELIDSSDFGCTPTNCNGVLSKWVHGLDYNSMHIHGHALAVYGGSIADTDFASMDDAGNIASFDEWTKDVRNYVAYVRDDLEDPYEIDNECNPLFKALFGASFVEHLKSVYNEKARTYSDILNGVPAYSEDLFYVIKKFRKDNGTEEERNVQNIIIPNTSDLDIIDYVDTQVKYGAHATYRYDIYAYRVVFGSEYSYTFGNDYPVDHIDAEGNASTLIDPANAPISVVNSNFFEGVTYDPQAPGAGVEYEAETVLDYNFTVKVGVTVNPSIKLIGDKMFSTPPIKILDSPPVPPFVNIVPYRAVGDRIKIILASSTDTFRAEPINILDGDQESFLDIMGAQLSNDGKVEFSSDDRAANFQVFRVARSQLVDVAGNKKARPTSYNDFSLHPNEEIALIETGGSAVFDDSILPNERYYYIFRTVDNHGHVSNPTPVYEVELIDEKGAIKPIIRTISMELAENKAHSKELQKYILIKPTDRQIYFSEESDVNSIFSTNVEGDKKKKYKMRITSKGTGKKIDINFSFTKNCTNC